LPNCDILLVNPGGSERMYQALGSHLTAIEPPLWARLIAGYVLDRGFTPEIVDSEAENCAPASVAEIVAKRRALLIAVIVFGHQPSASTQQMTAAGEVCRAIKLRDPEQKIIILGGHVSALPVRTMSEEAVDYACIGEGPVTVNLVLEALRAKEDALLSKVPGLAWRSGGRILVNPAAPLIKDLDQDLHGNAWHLLSMEKYRAHNWQCFGMLDSRQPYASIYTSLGCPYQCTFCCINAPFGTNRYRMRDPQKVVEEIDFLFCTYGVRTYKIIDEMFVLNEQHVTSICEQLAGRSYAGELNIWAYARVDTIEPRKLTLLRRAGIRWLALGIESGSEYVRNGAQKPLSSADITGIVNQIKEAGINVMGNFIFGLPDDDLTTMRETLDLAKDLNCEYVNFYCAMAYPGSRLYKIALEQNWSLPDTWAGYSQHSYECKPLPTRRISAAEVLKFRDDAFIEYFTNLRYLNSVTHKFGIETRDHIERMAHVRLRRKLLEEKEL
jgi:anaerobic magnesium-protoporphyrin IX monomethyl ester cyclase